MSLRRQRKKTLDVKNFYKQKRVTKHLMSLDDIDDSPM